MSLLDDVKNSNTYISGSSTVGTGTLLDAVKGTTPQPPSQAIQKTPEKKVGFFEKAKSVVGSVLNQAGKFIARTGVAAGQLATETIDFSLDLLGSSIEQKIKNEPLVGISFLPSQKPKDVEFRTNLANQWRSFYDKNVGSNTEKAKAFTESLSKLDYVKPSEEWNKAPISEKLTTKLGETVLNIGPGIVASLGSFALNPTLGFVVSSGSTADEINTIAQDAGMPKEKAQALGLATGMVVGFLDKVVPDDILSPQEKKLFISQIAKKVAVSGLKETVTEMTQEGVQLLVEATLRKDLKFDEVKTRVILAGLGGFLGGSSMQSLASVVNNIRSGEIADVKPEDIKKEPKLDTTTFAVEEKGKPTESPEVTTLGQETTVYRGAKDQTIDVTRPNGITGGVSMSVDKETAQRFADKVGGTVAEYKLPADARVVNHSFLETLPKNEVQQYIKDNNIDAVRFDIPSGAKGEAEIRVVNDKILQQITTPAETKVVVPKELEDLKDFALSSKSESEFVADAIFTSSLSGVETKALEDNYKGESTADKLSDFYNLVRQSKVSETKQTIKYDAGKIEGYEVGKPRQYRIIESGNKIKNVQGIPVKIVDGVDTFIHEGDGGWVVSEATSGRYISDSRSKGGAIAKADTIIYQQGVEKFNEAIAKNILPQESKPLSPTKGVSPSQAQRGTPPPPKAIKLKPVKKVSRGVLTTDFRKKIEDNVAQTFTANSKEEVIKKVNNLVNENLNDIESPIYEQKLKTIKEQLKNHMYDIVGANTGDAKKDYTHFLQTKSNPEFSEIVDTIEDNILAIDEATNPEAPSSTLGHASTGAVALSEFEQRSTPKRFTEEFKLYEKVKALTAKYASTIGEGYTPRKALGVYYTKTKNIRVNAINNLSVVSHEVTHFLDEKFGISNKLMAINGYSEKGNPIYNPLTKKYRKEITDLYIKYYPGGKKGHSLRTRTLEGFATLLQKYIEMPTVIEKEYPLLVKDFLKNGGKYYQPVMGEIINDLNSIVEEYQGLSSLDKIGSKVTSDAINADKSSFLNLGDKIRTFLADNIYPLEVLAKQSQTAMTSNDPSLWLRAYNSISGLVNNNISTDRGYWTLSGDGIKKVHDFNWKTLVDMTRKNKSTDDFGYFLVARREHFAYQELAVLKENLDKETKIFNSMPREDRKLVDETGRTPADRLKEAEDSYNSLYSILKNDGISQEEATTAYLQNKDRFVEEVKMFDTLTKSDLELMVDPAVQLITPQQFKELSSQQGYASFKRQFYDDIVGDNNDITGTARVGKTKVSSLLKRKGSERTIINPLYNGITNHSEVLRKAAKQVVYNKITDIGVSAMFPNLFQELDLKVAVDKETGAITYPQEKDSKIIMGRQGFKRKPILIDGELKSVIDNILTYQNVDVFMKLYTGLSRMFTAGTTGFYPQFAATNLLRDQMTAQVNTENKFKSLYSPLKTFGTILSKKDAVSYNFYQEYMIMGGERQTFTGWQKLPPKELFKAIAQEKSALETIIDYGEKATDILSIPSKYSELVTRASEYINARKSGKSPIVALEEAGRLTAPFHHIGTWGGKFGQTIIRGLPFFNASLQVLDQHARVLATPTGRKRAAFVMLAITAGYLAAAMKFIDASDEQKEQLKDLTPQELASFIYFPHPSGKKLIRVPVTNTFSQAGAIINMIIADRMFGAKYKASDYVDAATAWIPDQFDITEPIKAFLSWIPQIFKTGVEAVVGMKTYPKVSPLESQSLKSLPPALRYTENTSKFAKWLGSKLNLSPIKIDFIITGYFGRSMGFVTGQPSAYQFDSSIVRDYWFSGGRRVNAMYDLKEKTSNEYNAYQKHKVELTKEQEVELYRKYVLSDKFSEVMNDYRDVDLEKEQEKAAKLRNEALSIMEMIDNGSKPTKKQLPKSYSSFEDWMSEARKRRKENAKSK